MKEYWVKKERVPAQLVDSLNYTALARCMTALDFTKQRFISKWISNITPNGKNMIRWENQYKGNCPFCNDKDEDNQHILECKDENAKEKWNEALSKLLKKFKRLDTCRYLKRALKKELMAWKLDKQPQLSESYPEKLREVIIKQREIGWR